MPRKSNRGTPLFVTVFWFDWIFIVSNIVVFVCVVAVFDVCCCIFESPASYRSFVLSIRSPDVWATDPNPNSNLTRLSPKWYVA